MSFFFLPDFSTMNLFTFKMSTAFVVFSSVYIASTIAFTCNSMSGPFCKGLFGAPNPPQHALSDLLNFGEEFRAKIHNKKIQVENLLKTYELGEVTDPELDTLSIENVLEQVEKLLEKHEILSVDIEDSIVGSFALTNEEGTFEMLDSMTGDELKEYFETALEEVLQRFEVVLEDMSPGSTQSIRHTTNQLKSLEDIDSYSFETLDDTSRSKIESKFKEHRIIEVQKSFERLVMAKTNQDRQIAFESLVYLLQLANEENNSFAEGDIEPENIEEKV